MDSDDTDSGNIFSTYPFSWVLVPLIIFVGAGTLLVCYRYRRRRKLRMQYGTSALERDIEAMGNRSGSRAPNERRTRERRGLGLGFGSREEGLNELGEAPPAYTAAQKQPDHAEEVELRPISQPSNTVATEGVGTSRLPTYEDIRRDTEETRSATPPSTLNPPALPPRAVLSSNSN
ncbi:uncharacterized protein F4822DRAFT_399935 [Hypoxylon trugodes]|uniref:uncharacterized protein n=1 Tax=Hypoxylon trugodes TaxID=326681 RepID=UPI00218DA7E6|nr:uncharacterized protein F4822DRAFT_399935 [Hypoxylon trugodes]KAI1389837.1 hypothetical protein F4822DRAFT_399935 [Hypoxylon trugodes]